MILKNVFNPIKEYYKLHPKMRFQLRKISYIFKDNNEIYRKMNEYLNMIDLQDREKNDIKRKLYRLAIYNTIDISFILKDNFVKDIICYSIDGPIVELKKILDIKSHTIVIEGNLLDLPVIIKYHYHYHKKRDEKENYISNCLFELDIYLKLQKTKCDLPWISDKFSIWGEPVIVMERLHNINQYDDEYKMGIEILKQLEYLHKFGVHCDIKPKNIMKRLYGNNVKYLLIDYGGVATERLGHGYNRWIWSKEWTSQTKGEKKQIVTAKNDFLELGYTMKWIYNHRNNIKTSEYNCNTGFSGTLKKYMERVKKVNSYNIVHQDYVDLISILQNR